MELEGGLDEKKSGTLRDGGGGVSTGRGEVNISLF